MTAIGPTRRRLGTLLAPLLIATALISAPARAQPANDAFEAAERLPGETTVTTSNVGATKEPNEPEHAGETGGASIWFTYVAPETGNVTLNTKDSAIDTVLAVYTGQTVSALALVTFNDDDDSTTTSRATFQAQAGDRYRIAIDGKDGATGPIVLYLTTNLPRCDVLGTGGQETLRGSGPDEGICGLGGDDILIGGSGADHLVGGPGADTLIGGPGDDEFDGGEGRDTASYARSPAVVVDLSRRQVSGEGTDELTDIEVVDGSKRRDRMSGGPRADTLLGNGGNDVLDGAGGDDDLKGGAGNDHFTSGPGNDTFAGEAGRDSISFATSGKAVSVDLAFGGSLADGTDTIREVEEVIGTRKADVLRGGKGSDRLTGGGGADTLSGLGGRDVLGGGAAGDLIWGGEGKDRLLGGAGSDACHSGTGGASRGSCERTPPYDDWLGTVNLFRSISRLPRVMEDPALSEGDRLHARYVVKTDQGGHVEDPNNRWYSPAGASAAASSNVQWSSNVATSDAQAISYWMTGPYHAVGILNPSLDVVGYGSYREAGSPGYTEAAALDIIRGIGAPNDAYPIMWPGPNSSTPLAAYTGGEVPDPLASCRGYSAPTGLPLLLILDESAKLGAHSLRRGGAAVPHCAYELNSNTVVVIPRSPLSRGARYEVTVNAAGEKHSWGFRVR